MSEAVEHHDQRSNDQAVGHPVAAWPPTHAPAAMWLNFRRPLPHASQASAGHRSLAALPGRSKATRLRRWVPVTPALFSSR